MAADVETDSADRQLSPFHECEINLQCPELADQLIREGVMEDNIIRNNRDDGIEIRLHKYSGPTLDIVIRRNKIIGNKEDGIQIIDYPDKSDRVIRIERNLIAETSMAAIGCMSDGNTRENLEAADTPERIHVINNTFFDNEYGVTGGDSLIAVNNVLADTTRSALKKVDGGSVTAHNLFWNNGDGNPQGLA